MDESTPAGSASRRVALVRHAKAESGEGRDDHERELTGRGRRAAAEAGRWLAAHLPEPDLVWCSSAARARQTWDAVSASLGAGEVVTERDLYLASATDVVERVRGADVPAMVVVGHNPTIEEALRALTGERRGMAPGAVAVVDLSEGALVELWEPGR